MGRVDGRGAELFYLALQLPYFRFQRGVDVRSRCGHRGREHAKASHSGRPASGMIRLPNLTLRNALIASHDALASAVALVGSFYLRFEGDLLTDRLPLLFVILPYFVLFSVVVCYGFHLTTTKWRFISLPDALNIFRAATVLAVALLILDYIFVAPNVQGAFFFGKVTIVLFWFLEVSLLSAARFAYRYFRYTRVRYHAKA